MYMYMYKYMCTYILVYVSVCVRALSLGKLTRLSLHGERGTSRLSKFVPIILLRYVDISNKICKSNTVLSHGEMTP